MGVILQLVDVTDKSTLSVLVNGQKEAVNLAEVRSGKPQPLFNGGAVALPR